MNGSGISLSQLWLSITIALALVWTGTASAADHDESVSGDLSTNPASPTSLAVSPGSNVLTGTVQSGGDTRDYVTFTVSTGQVLVSINQIAYYDVISSGPGDRGFNAIIAGATSLVPGGATIGSFLGSSHLNTLTPGTDMLPTLAVAPTGGTGFAPPLGPGTYTYHVQQTGSELTGYEIDLVVAALPGVPLLGPLGLGVLFLVSACTGSLGVRKRTTRLIA